MLFNSLDFAIFLAICLPLYFALYALGAHRLQNRMLLIASYVFYAAWDWRFCFLIALSTTVDYCVARAMQGSSWRKGLLGISLFVNLGLLGYFKYANFFLESLGRLLSPLGVSLEGPILDVILPVGISFYTFQTLSYVIDVYRRNFEPVRNLFDYALYVSFFPQLVAGPIERAYRLMPQISKRREVSWEGLSSGAWLIFWGTFKKVVIADNLAVMVDLVYSSASSPTSLEAWLATYAFTFQIYCDFSGYTDVARGVARIMGFDLMLNFRLPFLARNPADFFQRWHISLSTWIRDYVFVSLAKNRLLGWMLPVVFLFYARLIITWTLGGLWHGASWHFVLWGVYYGVLLSLHRLMRPLLVHMTPAGRLGRSFFDIASIFTMFHLTCFGMVIFRAESVPAIATHLALLFGPMEVGFGLAWLLPFGVLIAPLVLMQIAQARSDDLEIVLRWPLAVRTSIYLVLALMLVTMGEDGGKPFIYFQF